MPIKRHKFQFTDAKTAYKYISDSMNRIQHAYNVSFLIKRSLVIPMNVFYTYTGCLFYNFLGRVPGCWDIQWKTVIIPPLCSYPIAMLYGHTGWSLICSL